jgi:hypothetical protein
LAFGVWRLAFGVWRLAFGVCTPRTRPRRRPRPRILMSMWSRKRGQMPERAFVPKGLNEGSQAIYRLECF